MGNYKRAKAIAIIFLLICGRVSHAQRDGLSATRNSLHLINDSLRYVDALNRMAMLLYEKNMDSTFYYARQAREIAGRLSYKQGIADATNNLGVFFDIKGNLQLSLRYYNDAYSIYKQLQDPSNCVQSPMNIAMVYKELGKDDRAIAFFEEAINAGRHLHMDSIMSLAIYNYLLAYPESFGKDSTGYYINKARGIASRYRDRRTLIAIDQLIADSHIAHGNFAEGIILLQRTIDTALAWKLYYVSMDMFIDLGNQLVTSNPARALSAYKQGLAIATQNGYLIYSSIIARKLFDFFSERGDSLSAASYSKQLVALHDEQEKLDNASSIDYLDYALKEEQVHLLTSRAKYQKALLVLTIIICLLAVMVAILIRRNLKRSRLLNQEITKQNRQMREALTSLEQSQAENTKMMQVVAHDLRNPIGAMYTAANMLMASSGHSEEDRNILQLIERSGKNALDLVNDLLHVHFQTGNLKKEPVNIGEVLRYCVAISLYRADAKQQEIKLEAPDITIQANREKIWRVISNLVTNAIKFSPEGAAIDVGVAHISGTVRINVSDHGIGIPASMKDKVFDLFTNAKRQGTSGEQAFGLGLAISKQIVEAHGGKIWFEDNAGGGTTFFVELPIDA